MTTEPVLKPQHRTVMRCLSEVGYATYQQLARYGAYSPRSYTHITETTNALLDGGFVAFDFAKRGSEVGRSKRIFTYTKRGRRYCAQEVSEALLPVTSNRHDEVFQAHKAGVADLVIAAYQFARADPERASVLRIQIDLVTNRTPITFPLDGKAVRLIPDLWAELLIDGVRRPFAFEYDRNTERSAKGERQWREKIRKYVAGLRGPIQQYFDVRGCLVTVVIDPARKELAPRRMQTLLDWTEKELTALFPRAESARQWGQRFRFAVADPGTCNPTALFTAPWWVSPFDATPRALSDREGA